MVSALFVLWTSASTAAEPLPAGSYLDDCSACSVTRVGTAGAMLGCMCTTDGLHRSPASLWLLGGTCPVPIRYEGGDLVCADPQASPAARLAAAPAAPAEVPPTEPVRVEPAVYGASARPPAPVPAGQLVASAAPVAQPLPEAQPLEVTVDAWNAAGRTPIRLAPAGCMVTPDGVMACTCPDASGVAVPRVARLDGAAEAWTCGCTDKVGLICLPTR